MNQRRREVRHAAVSLLEQLGINSVPIDPDHIAASVGLEISERPDFPNGVYGALYRAGNSFGICVSSRCPTRGHRRFSVAHELGHYSIDGHLEAMFGAGAELVPSQASHFRARNNPLEREADWFAADLLVPAHMSKPLVDRLTPELDSIREVESTFSTSFTCAAVRYAEITEDAVAVVLSNRGQVEWVAFSPRMWEQRWARRAWKRQQIPASTATGQMAANADRVERGEELTSRSLMCEWFEGAPGDIIADEESVGLGHYGRVLTLLVVSELPDPDEDHLDPEGHEEEPVSWRDALRGFRLG